jgi:LacI family transcriptional regulator, galactose operon repressor
VRRHVSVKDVAARCGVSFQTTSKVLNGKGSVSAATRARILRAAQDLGYVPNLAARSLVMRRTQTVGMIVGSLGDQNLSRFIVGAEREARRQGYAVVIWSVVSEDGPDAGNAFPALVERRVDGILLGAPELEDDPDLAVVRELSVPVVSIHHVPGGGVSLIGSDHELGGYLATRHLLQRGHRCIATIVGVRARRVTQSRLRGYRRALTEAGIALDDQLVDEAGWQLAQAFTSTTRLLQRRPDITAIFAQNDQMAVGAMSALRSLGKRVPQDVAVIGYDDIPVAAYVVPALSTVRVPFAETGAEAMRVLLRLLSGGDGVPRKTLLPLQLVERESTAAQPGRARTRSPARA